MRGSFLRRVGLAAALVWVAATCAAAADAVRSAELRQARRMLKVVKGELEKHYYDPGFHGIDLDARFEEAEKKMAGATSPGHLLGIIAQAVLDLDDSHIWFVPPLPGYADYGWRIQFVGDRCFVTEVEEGSDAEAQGIRRGDAVLEVEGWRPTRLDLWRLRYRYERLRPQASLNVVVQAPSQAPRQVRFKGTLVDGVEYWKEVHTPYDPTRNHALKEVGDIAVWKMGVFDLQRGGVRRFMEKAGGHKALVLDLRGNGGGSQDTLLWVVSSLFDREVKVADIKTRKGLKPWWRSAATSRSRAQWWPSSTAARGPPPRRWRVCCKSRSAA